MAVTNSPNMNLPIPGVGTEAGPDYAFDVNNCLTLIDTHDHTPGRGVQITPAGLNINTDLAFNANSATHLLNVVFNSQASATSTLMALSVAPGSEGPPLQDLWYTDSAGNKVQITANGALAAVTTTVQGITYNLGTFTFDQTQDSLPTTPANLDAGSVTIRPNTALTPFGVELSPSGGISSQYTLTLPLPVAQTSFVTQNSSGILSGSIPIAGGITQSNLAANSVGTAQIIPGSVQTNSIGNAQVTLNKLAPLILTATSFGPFAPSGAPTEWYLVPGNVNSITLGPGQWRLTGSVAWNSTANAFNDVRYGWFGTNGSNTPATPTALTVASQQSGRLGQIFGLQLNGVNMFTYAATIPETIITLSAPSTVIFLDMFHGSFTGAVFTFQGTISAEQIR